MNRSTATGFRISALNGASVSYTHLAHFDRCGTECWFLTNEGNDPIDTELLLPTKCEIGSYDMWNGRAEKIVSESADEGLSLIHICVDLIFSLTNGGPVGKTTTLSMLIANQALTTNNYGYGSAISVVSFLILTIIAIIYMKASGFAKGSES